MQINAPTDLYQKKPQHDNMGMDFSCIAVAVVICYPLPAMRIYMYSLLYKVVPDYSDAKQLCGANQKNVPLPPPLYSTTLNLCIDIVVHHLLQLLHCRATSDDDANWL